MRLLEKILVALAEFFGTIRAVICLFIDTIKNIRKGPRIRCALILAAVTLTGAYLSAQNGIQANTNRFDEQAEISAQVTNEYYSGPIYKYYADLENKCNLFTFELSKKDSDFDRLLEKYNKKYSTQDKAEIAERNKKFWNWKLCLVGVAVTSIGIWDAMDTNLQSYICAAPWVFGGSALIYISFL